MTRKNLLIDILSVQTTSGNEFDMISYIHKFCKTNVPAATIKIKDNNIYISKGKTNHYPCIVAHTDTVHDIHKSFKVYDDNGCLFAFNSDTGTQVGVGGDDKVGIWLALEMLVMFDNIKCAFFHSEEVGCIGSRAADMSFFKDVGYCFQGDRRGNSDFVNSISGKLFSKRFSKKINPIISKFGYAQTSGAITDVGQLAENGVGVCVANMSCGYYAPHSDAEVVRFDDANNCLNMLMCLVQELGCNKYDYTYSPTYSYNNTSKWGDWYGADRDFWYDDEVEVITNESGEEMCYYCNSRDLQESSFKGYKFCPDCESDIVSCEDTINEEKEKLDYADWKEYNESFDEYEDLTDNYDDSIDHRALVNKYLTKNNK